MPELSYHFHVYYPIEGIEKARSLVSKFSSEFDFEVGRLWDKPVGPHPIGSCQITIPGGEFEKVMLWFTDNRDGLDLFIHQVTGDDLRDHTIGTMWMGKSYDLNLDMFLK